MANDASKSVSMITHSHNNVGGTASTSGAPHDVAIRVTANDNVIGAQPNQSSRRLRNLLLAGNAVAWIVIILAARALFF
jgi:hypothetical protein